MRFVRGSHKWGLLNQGNFYGQDHEEQRQAITVPDGEAWEEVSAILPSGGTSFHHNLTFHGSGPKPVDGVETKLRHPSAHRELETV